MENIQNINNTSNYEWNEYIINRNCIGKGMYSKVYYGYHKKTKQEIALKKIYFNNLQNKMKERIIREINILKKINHINIIKLYDYKFDGEYILLITEYCKDKNLKEWIIKDTKEPKNKENVIEQIIKGVNYLHKNGIIHRDIKPENILFDNDIIKICDFGFSTIIKDELDLFNTMCGTPLYMSPEILFLKPYTIKSEIWALGVLFYVIIYERHPYEDLKNIENYRLKLKDKEEVKFINEKIDEKIENTSFLYKLIPIIKEMIDYSEEKRPLLNNIMNILNIKDDEKEEKDEKKYTSPTPINTPYKFPNISNLSYSPGNIITPIGSFGSNFSNSPSDVRITELEEKINKLESIIKNMNKDNKDDNNKDKEEILLTLSDFNLQEDYFNKNKQEEDDLKLKSTSKPIEIKRKVENKGSFISNISNSFEKFGTIYNFLSGSK
jgi:serine/threonine protein kinase